MPLLSWHEFAVSILGYTDTATLPPQSSEDVSRWPGLFSCSATTANHLSYLRWACRERRKSLHWSDACLSSLLKAKKKVHVATRIAGLPDGVRFTEAEMKRMILLA